MEDMQAMARIRANSFVAVPFEVRQGLHNDDTLQSKLAFEPGDANNILTNEGS